MTRSFDVIVIGGGPAGSATATLLAQMGRRVALFEKRAFPRFHIGESLVPGVNLTLAKLGVLDRLDQRRFPRKHGVQFLLPRGPTRPFYFSEVKDPRMQRTWQVLRSDFDDLLLQNAASAGVHVAPEFEVLDVRLEGNAVVGVSVRGPDGAETAVDARVVADASGQRGLLARRFGQRAHIDRLENTAVFAHYVGVALDSGIDRGSTLVFRLDAFSWLWLIPLPDAVSIGLVAPARGIWSRGGTPAEILDHAIAGCRLLQERLTAARRTSEVYVARDYSYRAGRDGGDGWLLVGDALGFIDPIYSTGLFLAMQSAELAAAAIAERLNGARRPPDFTGFSQPYQDAFDRFLVLVRAFYCEDFHFGRLAAEPRHRQGLIDMLTGLVTTAEAVEVTRAIQRAFDENITS